MSVLQGAASAVFQNQFVLFAGWTSTWETMRNDVHVLKIKDSRDVQSSPRRKKESSQLFVRSQRCSPSCAPTISRSWWSDSPPDAQGGSATLAWAAINCDGDPPPPSRSQRPVVPMKKEPRSARTCDAHLRCAANEGRTRAIKTEEG